MKAIFKREFKSHFISVTGFIFIAIMLLFAGLVSTFYNLVAGYPNFEMALFIGSYAFIFLVPVLTMRSIAGERRWRTDQLLYSLPLSMSKIVLGKYLAMVCVLLLPCLILCLYPVILSLFGTIVFTTAYGTMIGLFLLGCAMLAIGMFMSSLIDSPGVSYILAVAAFGVFLALSLIAGFLPATPFASLLAFSVIAAIIAVVSWVMARNVFASVVLAVVLEAPLIIVYKMNSVAFEGLFKRFADSLSLFTRLSDFSEGIFDITTLVYYLSLVVVFVFFTVQSMDKRRWS